MSTTFTDIYGNKKYLESLQNQFRVEVGVDKDLVSKEVTGYHVLLDGEESFEITEEVYNALKEIL